MLRLIIVFMAASASLMAQGAAVEQPADSFDQAPDMKNPGIRLVVNMLDEFRKMSSNRQKYLDGERAYDNYMKRDKEFAVEVSKAIDFYDVCEKSLKYDYNAKKKKFMRDHWAKRTAADKNNFVSIFRQLIESIVYPIAGEYFGDLKLKHKVLEQKTGDIHLQTIIKGKTPKKRRNREFTMEWFLHPKAEGGWIIYDISIEEERWVPGFRSQFNDVISKKNYAELIRLMKKKLNEELEDRERKDKQALEDKRKAKKTAKKTGSTAEATTSKTEEKHDGTTN